MVGWDGCLFPRPPRLSSPQGCHVSVSRSSCGDGLPVVHHQSVSWCTNSSHTRVILALGTKTSRPAKQAAGRCSGGGWPSSRSGGRLCPCHRHAACSWSCKQASLMRLGRRVGGAGGCGRSSGRRVPSEAVPEWWSSRAAVEILLLLLNRENVPTRSKSTKVKLERRAGRRRR
jgi:hypothetical protein